MASDAKLRNRIRWPKGSIYIRNEKMTFFSSPQSVISLLLSAILLSGLTPSSPAQVHYLSNGSPWSRKAEAGPDAEARRADPAVVDLRPVEDERAHGRQQVELDPVGGAWHLRPPGRVGSEAGGGGGEDVA